MNDLFKIVLENGDHWALIILFVLFVFILLFQSGLFKGLYKRENYKVILNILWGAILLTAFVVTIILTRDYFQMEKDQHLDDNKTQVELEKIRASFQQVKENPQLVQGNPSLEKLFSETANSVFSQQTQQADVHADQTIDNNRCWIKTGYGSQLKSKPSAMESSTIAKSIPQKVYYVIKVDEDRQYNLKFFKIRLDNGLEGWVQDFNLDMNPKCVE